MPVGDERGRDVCLARECERVHYANPNIVVGAVCLWEGKVRLSCAWWVPPLSPYSVRMSVMTSYLPGRFMMEAGGYASRRCCSASERSSRVRASGGSLKVQDCRTGHNHHIICNAHCSF